MIGILLHPVVGARPRVASRRSGPRARAPGQGVDRSAIIYNI